MVQRRSTLLQRKLELPDDRGLPVATQRMNPWVFGCAGLPGFFGIGVGIYVAVTTSGAFWFGVPVVVDVDGDGDQRRVLDVRLGDDMVFVGVSNALYGIRVSDGSIRFRRGD